jgi:protease-4
MSQNPNDTPSASEPHEPLAAMIFSWLKDQEIRRTDEVRRERRWRNLRAGFFALSILAGPLMLAALGSSSAIPKVGDNYVALVRVNGVIAADNPANGNRIGEALERAFADRKAKGVLIAINSPGGSPVQSAMIRDRLVMLREAHPDTKVWAVGEDMLTSGAYFIAMGAPNVCVNRSTVTGSIGVIQDSWGLDRAINKLGIERRVFTAGTAKNRMDMFQPLTEADRSHASTMLDAVHEHFKAVVREGRGTRLKRPEAELFTGDYWTGDVALAFGLVDRLCNLQDVLAEEFRVHDAKDYTPRPTMYEALSSAIGTQVSASLTRTATTAPVPQLLPGW